MNENPVIGTVVNVKGALYLKIPEQEALISLEHLASSEDLRKNVGKKVEVFFSAPHIAGLRSAESGDWTMLCYAPAMLKNIVVRVDEAEKQRVLDDMVKQGYVTKAAARRMAKGAGATSVNTFK